MKILAENIDPDRLAVIALGSDLPGRYADCRALLDAAIAALDGAGLAILAQSSWWRSAAWPDPSKPPYLNGVVLVEPSVSPAAMLALLHDLERHFGRERHVLNAPRTLDLDLIAYGRLIVDQDGLTLPHPRSHERLFVMGPLAEIAPGWRHPALKLDSSCLAKTVTIGLDAAPQA